LAILANFLPCQRYLFLKSDDLALIQRCRGGDRLAAHLLVERHQRAVFNAAFRILGRRQDAEDVTQATFLKVFEHLDGYDAKYKLFSWIYRIAVNEAIDQLHRNRQLQALDTDEEAGGGDPEELAATDLLSRRVQAGLMELAEEYRVVTVLRHFSELSYEQIADVLGIPEKTVKSRIYTARQQLKELLVARGVSWL